MTNCVEKHDAQERVSGNRLYIWYQRRRTITRMDDMETIVTFGTFGLRHPVKQLLGSRSRRDPVGSRSRAIRQAHAPARSGSAPSAPSGRVALQRDPAPRHPVGSRSSAIRRRTSREVANVKTGETKGRERVRGSGKKKRRVVERRTRRAHSCRHRPSFHPSGAY